MNQLLKRMKSNAVAYNKYLKDKVFTNPVELLAFCHPLDRVGFARELINERNKQ